MRGRISAGSDSGGCGEPGERVGAVRRGRSGSVLRREICGRVSGRCGRCSSGSQTRWLRPSSGSHRCRLGRPPRCGCLVRQGCDPVGRQPLEEAQPFDAVSHQPLVDPTAFLVGRVKISVSSRLLSRCRAVANSGAASALRVWPSAIASCSSVISGWS